MCQGKLEVNMTQLLAPTLARATSVSAACSGWFHGLSLYSLYYLVYRLPLSFHNRISISPNVLYKLNYCNYLSIYVFMFLSRNERVQARMDGRASWQYAATQTWSCGRSPLEAIRSAASRQFSLL